MKKTIALILILIPILASTVAFAQSIEGEVLYTETTAINIKLPPEMQHMADRFPKSFSSNKVLVFSNKAALYKAGTPDPTQASSFAMPTAPMGGGGGEGEMRVSFGNAGGQVDTNIEYVDLESKKTIEKNNFFDRDFLITEDTKTLEWQLTAEQKQILGYTCVKAVLLDSTRAVSAWFTPELPVPSGPQSFGQLPGLILEINMAQNGMPGAPRGMMGNIKSSSEITLSAVKIDLKPLPTDALKTPDSGQKMSRVDYDKMVQQKMQEMREMYGGRGGMGGGGMRTGGGMGRGNGGQ